MFPRRVVLSLPRLLPSRHEGIILHDVYVQDRLAFYSNGGFVDFPTTQGSSHGTITSWSSSHTSSPKSVTSSGKQSSSHMKKSNSFISKASSLPPSFPKKKKRYFFSGEQKTHGCHDHLQLIQDMTTNRSSLLKFSNILFVSKVCFNSVGDFPLFCYHHATPVYWVSRVIILLMVLAVSCSKSPVAVRPLAPGAGKHYHVC